MQPKHLTPTSAPHVFHSPLLEWYQGETTPPGYKASTRYPGWHWKNRTDTTPAQVVAPPPVKVDMTRPYWENEEGWYASGNCIQCGEAGRCECLHQIKRKPGPALPEKAPAPTLPTLLYPVQFYAQEAVQMEDELKSSSGVRLAENPLKPGSVNRIRISENPGWYRKAYKQGYTSRDTMLSTLRQFTQGKIDTSKKYAGKVVRIIEDRLKDLADTFPEFAMQLNGNAANLTPTSGD